MRKLYGVDWGSGDWICKSGRGQTRSVLPRPCTIMASLTLTITQHTTPSQIMGEACYEDYENQIAMFFGSLNASYINHSGLSRYMLEV